jgi:hypothetical protein
MSFAFTMRIFERLISSREDVGVSDTIWIVALTMTTIGFGDFVPKQIFAKLMCFFICIIGIAIQSMFIVQVQKQTNFED